MDSTNQHSVKLVDRVLWFDGTSEWMSSNIEQSMLKYPGLVSFVDAITPDIAQYNSLVSPDAKLSVHPHVVDSVTPTWMIPDKFKTLDVVAHVSKLHDAVCHDMNDDVRLARDIRLARELSMFKKLGLFDVLRGTVWLVNTLIKTNAVWGVGRGSSVASYVLYVIGVHDVDSFEYELDVMDFLHE